MENINNTQPIVKNFKQKLAKKMVLIDLNQNMINFQCNFVVQSQGVPFQAVVVTQEQLDSPDFQVEYQNVVNGIIEAEIENVSNVYNNYCLLLKSEQECEVDVQINIVPLPETVKEEFTEPVAEEHPVSTPIDVPFYKTNTFAWIIIFIGIVLIIYLLFSDNKKGNTDSGKIEIVKSPGPVIKSPGPVITVVKSPAPVMKSPAPIMKSPAPIMKSPAPVMKSPAPIMKSPPSLLSKLKNTQI
jgi:hypothetical protein